jgi:hypothetical protein
LRLHVDRVLRLRQGTEAMSRPCRIEWSYGRRETYCADYEQACEIIQAAHRHCVIESDNGELDEILCWKNSRMAGLHNSTIAVIRFTP